MRSHVLAITFFLLSGFILRAGVGCGNQEKYASVCHSLADSKQETRTNRTPIENYTKVRKIKEINFLRFIRSNLKKFMNDIKKRKRFIAALLAFPLPFGFLGLHRIYLGTEPYVPLIYICTLGGLLILPFIDFMVILLDKDITRFENNKNIFMWIK